MPAAYPAGPPAEPRFRDIADNRAVDVFIDELDLPALGFAGVVPEATARPSHHPSHTAQDLSLRLLNQGRQNAAEFRKAPAPFAILCLCLAASTLSVAIVKSARLRQLGLNIAVGELSRPLSASRS